MTYYVFPDPAVDVKARLEAAKAARWPTATIGTAFPASPITVPHIQHAWDGTPTQEQQRERCTIRITCWTPKGRVSDANALAALVQAVMLDSGSANVWRYIAGTGRLPGIDPDTKLPFCTFTLTAETRPSAVA